MVLLNVPGSSARRCDPGDIELYIVENAALEQLLFDRNTVGLPFAASCLEASKLFLAHLQDDLASEDDLAELVILSKGLVYQVGRAAAEQLSRAVPTNLIATRRASVSGDDAQIAVSYQRLDAGGSALVIGDTVASGATVVAALSAYREHYNVETLYLFSLAGARVGATRIAKYCSDQGIRLRMLFGLAAFGLADNGFDLSFLHPDTIASPRYRERAETQFGGKPASAVGWDFGSQVMSPSKYRQLCWMEAEKWGLHGHPSFSLEQLPTSPDLLAGEAAAFLL